MMAYYEVGLSRGVCGWLMEQAQGYCGRPMKYKGMWDVLSQAVEKEGVRGLYKVSSFPFPMCNSALNGINGIVLHHLCTIRSSVDVA